MILVFTVVTAVAQSPLYDEALAKYQDQEFFAAMIAARKLVEQDEHNATYRHLYGLALAALEQFTEAEENLRKAIELHPDRADFQYDLAVVFLRQGKEKEAVPFLEKVIERTPDNLSARLYLGRIYHNRNFSQRALEQFRKIAEEDPEFPWVHHHIAKIHRNYGNADRAVQELKQEVALHSDNAVARLELAELLVSTGKVEEAQTHLGVLEKKIPRSHQVHYLLAKTQWARGEIDRAIASAQKSAELKPDFADAQYLLSQLYRTNGDEPQAKRHIELFQRYRKETPGAHP